MEAQHPGLLRFTSGFGQTTALLMAGELDRAQELAQQLTDFAQMQQPGRAIGEILVADVLIARGEFGRRGEAVARGGRSAGADRVFLGTAGVDAAGPGARSAQDETAEASKILSRADSRHGLKSMLFAPELLSGARRGRWRRGVTRSVRAQLPATRHERPSAAASRRWRCERFTTRCGSATPVPSMASPGLPCRRRLRVRRFGAAARPRPRRGRNERVAGGVRRVRRHRHDGRRRRRVRTGRQRVSVGRRCIRRVSLKLGANVVALSASGLERTSHQPHPKLRRDNQCDCPRLSDTRATASGTKTVPRIVARVSLRGGHDSVRGSAGAWCDA